MFKSAVKKSIYKLMASTPEQAREKIQDKSVISFDVFDTLVKRDTASPEDVFILMERAMQEECGFWIDGFATLRKQAEKTAREKFVGRDVTLEEIYSCVPADPGARKKLMEMECQMEVGISTPALPMKRLYEACLEQQKKIIFISDMYLPAKTIREILEKSGYTAGELYVSSENGMTKRNGTLFLHVKEQEKINVHQWAHIGDTITSDYLVPKRMGIQSVLVEREPKYNQYIDRKMYKCDPGYKQLNHFIDTRLSRYDSPYERLGYAVLGPMLYGFSRWLEKEIPVDDTIVFLAREGALLQKAFQVVSTRPSKYLYTSRRAANLALLDHVQGLENTLYSSERAAKEFRTFKQRAKDLGLSDDEISMIFSRLGLKEDDIVSSVGIDRRLVDEIWPAVKQKSAGQHELLQRYLKQLGLTENCAVVDIGWKGTIQSLLNDSCYVINEVPIRWSGYYLGLLNRNLGPSYVVSKKKGFLFDQKMNTKAYAVFQNSSPFCEMLFLSTEGGTDKYEEAETGCVTPVLGNAENSGDIVDNICLMQDAAIQFVQELYMSAGKDLIGSHADTFAGNYESLAGQPTLATLALFSDYRFYDGYPYQLVSQHSFTHYLFHPRQFIHDFEKRSCKAWFLKSVFKLPLPYIQVLSLLRDIFESGRLFHSTTEQLNKKDSCNNHGGVILYLNNYFCVAVCRKKAAA